MTRRDAATAVTVAGTVMAVSSVLWLFGPAIALGVTGLVLMALGLGAVDVDDKP